MGGGVADKAKVSQLPGNEGFLSTKMKAGA